MNNQDVNSDHFAYTIPVDPSLIHEAPGSETDVHETPMEGKVVQEMPMDVTIAHETPVGESIVHEKLMSETIAHKAPVGTNVVSSASLLNREESKLLRTRWNHIQGMFVDEPHIAVEQADALVCEVI